MGKTVNQRLRRVGDRLAKIGRRLGFLEARFYWRRSGVDGLLQPYEWQEIPSWEVSNSGFGATDGGDQVFIGEQKERSFSVKVNKDWFESHRGDELKYEYGFKFADTDDIKPCSFLNHSANDADTFSTISFQEVRFGGIG
jgi:hypothetical protein